MQRFAIEYFAAARDELRSFRVFDRARILSAIEKHLSTAPTQTTLRRIKRVEPPMQVEYRLAVGDFRVFYNVDEAAMIVSVVAVRHKGRMTLEEAARGESP